MFFSDVYSVPAQTTAQAPAWRKLRLMKGTIVQWGLYGPDEKANILHVRVEYHGHAIIPFGGSTWMYPLDTGTPIKELIEVSDPPFDLDIYAYNEDDSYAHEYIFFVIVEPTEPVVIPETGMEGLWERIKGYFGGE